MGRITVLDEKIVSLIAAGEVIERPASVVKELVENALDAGADAVTVEIAGGGLERLTVSDNGCGMDEEDAVLALTRHATSKIRTPEDLEAIATLGFRGEALASIALVSRLTIKTRPPGAAAGTLVEAVGGQVLAVRPAGCPAGTTVSVADTFFNVPARRKFIKNPAFESALAAEMAARLALAAPGVRFTVVQNGRHILSTPGKGRLLDAVCAVLGAEVAQDLVEVGLAERGLRVHGYVSRPGLHRSSRRYQYFFINGRPVRFHPLAAAVEDMYGGLLPVGRHPVVVLHVEMDAAAVDVNVHPAKWEVRLHRQQVVTRAVGEAVRRALGRPAPAGAFKEHPGRAGAPVDGVAMVQALFSPETPGAAREAAEVYAVLPAMEPLAFLPPVYILARSAGGLVIVDQHAAHERVLYEEYLEKLTAETRAQLLAMPVTLEPGPQDACILETYAGFLADAGFLVEPFGARSFVLRGVPAFLSGPAGAEEIHDLLGALAAERPSTPGSFRDLLAKTLACRRAVKAGEPPALAEARALLTALARTASPHTCPHGRPTFVTVGYDELARRFLRA
ncbi:MAG: DNA mismatch repair endonuclease MutL [Desulfotomaculales bacterium]